MGLTHDQVTVDDSATEVVAAHPTEYRTVWLRVPSGGSSVFVGNSSVTTSNGFEVEAQETQQFALEAGESLHGIVSTGTQTVAFFAA